MSAMNNKDRINENNDTIKRLTELVKQKTLGRNPRLARTEDEMNAMLTDKNVGKVVKYLGEDGGAIVRTPIVAGDTIDKLYFNTSVEPDLSVFDFSTSPSLEIIDLATDNTLMAFDLSGASGGSISGHALVISGAFTNFQPAILYASTDFDFGGISATKGWNTVLFDENGRYNLITDEMIAEEIDAFTIRAVNQQDLWSSYIGKEPFPAGSKYEKNALYIIAEAGEVENPTAVGDEVTQVYFDATKSNEEILQAIQSLDWDNPDYNRDGKAINLFVEEQGGTTGMNFVLIDGNLMGDGNYHALYAIGQSGDFVWLYSSTISASAMGLETWGWIGSSPKTLQAPFTVSYIGHKEIWGGWLSAHENGFTNIDELAAPRARRLNITEGSLIINKNGKFDVSNKETVSVNTPVPKGTLVITENGTYDVSYKESIKVNTPVPEGTLSITENGTYDVAYKGNVEVNTPVPEGTLVVTKNGTHDVSYKANVIVNVAGDGSDSNKLLLMVGEQSTDNPYDITASDLNGMTEIGDYAFYQKRGLRNITLPTNCTSIGDYVFSASNVVSADMPDVTNIGIDAFQNCEYLTSVSMPKVTKISKYSFYACSSLASIDISNATIIDTNAFYDCDSLISVSAPNVTSIGEYAFWGCSSLTSAPTSNVTSIGQYTFYGCRSLASVDLSNVTSIGRYAFRSCNALTSVNMPNVTSIGMYAFQFCLALTSVDMPNATGINMNAFEGCSNLTSLYMPNVKAIGVSAFDSCTSLTSVSMPSVTIVDGSAFRRCTSLTSVSMPSVTSISASAFNYCYALTSLTIPSTCTQIWAGALACGSSTNRCTFTFEGRVPPTIAAETFDTDKINKIIVPAGCGETYKTARNWTTYANYIEEATE